MATADALNDAVTAFRDPTRVAELRSRALADDVVLVLRVAAGDQAAVAVASERAGLDAEELFEAAIFYLQQILFGPSANAYRILGCPIDATQQRLKENYRWLIKWLHPDRNGDQWESVYADKVNIAWQSLKTPARRERYDAENSLDGLQFEAASTGLAVHAAPTSPVVDREVLLSGSLVRHLPAITLSIMGLGAAVLLALIYWVNGDTQSVAMPTIAQSERVEIDGAPASASPTSTSVAIATADDGSIYSPNASQTSIVGSELDPPDSASGTTEATVVTPDAVVSSLSGLTAPDEAVHEAVARLLAAADQEASTNQAEVVDNAADFSAPREGQRATIGESPVPAIASAAQTSAEIDLSASTSAGTNANPVLTGSTKQIGSPVPVQLGANQVEPSSVAQPAAGSAEQSNSLVRSGAAVQVVPASVSAAPSAAVLAQSPAPVLQPRSASAIRAEDTAAVPAPAVAPPASAGADASAAALAQSPAPVPQPRSVSPRRAKDTAAVSAPAVAAPVTLVAAPRANIRRMDPVLPTLERAPSATQAAALVEDFASAYTAGDLSRFDRLFSGSVTKHSDLNGLRGRMQESQMRFLELAEVRWEMDTETAIGYARYRETFVPQGERKAVTRVGDLQWVIRMNGSQPRIAAISVKASPR